jgi:hypothetical protein
MSPMPSITILLIAACARSTRAAGQFDAQFKQARKPTFTATQQAGKLVL